MVQLLNYCRIQILFAIAVVAVDVSGNRTNYRPGSGKNRKIGPAVYEHALLRLLLSGRISIRTNLNYGPGHNTRLVIEGGGGSF
jgi:hypothetical protein